MASRPWPRAPDAARLRGSERATAFLLAAAAAARALLGRLGAAGAAVASGGLQGALLAAHAAAATAPEALAALAGRLPGPGAAQLLEVRGCPRVHTQDPGDRVARLHDTSAASLGLAGVAQAPRP